MSESLPRKFKPIDGFPISRPLVPAAAYSASVGPVTPAVYQLALLPTGDPVLLRLTRLDYHAGEVGSNNLQFGGMPTSILYWEIQPTLQLVEEQDETSA